MFPKRRWLLLALLLALIGLTVRLGPFEQILGLHGTWVWTALIGLGAAAGIGGIGLILQKTRWLHCSRGFGQSSAQFWISLLPLSFWAMHTNWNWPFLLEPHWQLGVQIALVAVLLQSAILRSHAPRLIGLVNISCFFGLLWALSRTEQPMHPPSPILNSGSSRIHLYFIFLLLLCLLAGGLISRDLLSLQAGY
ncbi:MAG: hypothetical protein ACLFWD_07320 [Anaerolineales bacterium]